MPHPISSTHVGNHQQEIRARPFSQCIQSSPTSVFTRSSGHSQTITKSKILSFWLLFAIAPNNRMKKQLKCRQCRYEQLKSCQLSKLFDHPKTVRASLLLCEQASAKCPGSGGGAFSSAGSPAGGAPPGLARAGVGMPPSPVEVVLPPPLCEPASRPS